MQEEIREIITVKITREGQVSIPLTLSARAGFEEGAKVEVISYDDRKREGHFEGK